jgi:hypothetical protein
MGWEGLSEGRIRHRSEKNNQTCAAQPGAGSKEQSHFSDRKLAWEFALENRHLRRDCYGAPMIGQANGSGRAQTVKQANRSDSFLVSALGSLLPAQ